MSTFKLRVSKVAIRLDFAKLTDEEKEVLLSGVAFDPNTHDIYRFFVAPDFDIVDKRPKKTRERKDYSLADTLAVKVEAPFPGFSFIGIYPTTTTIDDKPEAIHLPIVGDLKLSGIAKELSRRGKHFVLANQTDEFVSWFFLKPYFNTGKNFEMETVCVVPKSIPPEKRYIRCDAVILHKGKELEGARARRVQLPT